MIKGFAIRNYLNIPKPLLQTLATPRNLVVEPVAGCNYTCAACPQDILEREKGMMKLGQFKEIIDKSKPRSVGLYFMGEPFLNPEIFEMIEYAYQCKVKTTINTNGSTLLHDFEKIMASHLTKLCVSVDGISQESFEKYRRGVDARDVWYGLKMLSMTRSHVEGGPHIQVRSLAFDYNRDEMPQIKKYLELMNIYDHRVIDPIISGWGGKENKDMGVLGESGRVKDVRPKVCPSLFRCAVTWDGWVLPCCNDVHGSVRFGNLYDCDSLGDVYWRGDYWLLKAKRLYPICENCYEGEE